MSAGLGMLPAAFKTHRLPSLHEGIMMRQCICIVELKGATIRFGLLGFPHARAKGWRSIPERALS